MIKKTLFRDRQEARAEDFNAPQDYTQATLDHIVADAITLDARYKGLSVAQVSGTEITVGQGRLYDQGRVYDRDVLEQKNLIANLPVATLRIVTVVAFGQTIETNVEPRDFLIDLETGSTEPQAVAMTEIRRCQVGYLNSNESVSPTLPAVQSGQVKVAEVLLSPSGIVSITMSKETELGGLEGANTNIRDLTTWRHMISPRVDTLQSTLADVRDALKGKATLTRMIQTERNLSSVWRVLGLPSGVVGTASDQFVEKSQSDDAFAMDEAYLLNNGLFFPSADDVTTSLDLFNAIDTAVKKSMSGWVLPKHWHETALATAGPTGEINLSSYSVTTTEVQQYTTTQTVTQTATRTVRQREFENRDTGWAFLQAETGQSVNGVPFGTAQNVAGLAAGGWDYVRDVIEQVPYTYSVQVPVTRNRTVTSTKTVTGMEIAQTILSPRAMWLTKIGLNFTGLDSSGDLTLLLTRADASGRPDMKDVISETSVPYAALKTSQQTEIVIEPAFVEAGERIAIVIVTNGAHRHQTVSGVEDTQGSIFYGDDTGWKHTEDGKSFLFTLWAAHFERTNTELRLGDVNLSGGITDLRIATEEIMPAGTRLGFEYQFNGVWYPLEDGHQLVSQKPSTVPLRAIFTGTTTLQPALKTGADRVTGAISGTAMVHYSTLLSLPAASTEVYVDLDVHWWEAGEDTVTVELLNADDGDAVIAAVDTEVIEQVQIRNRDGNETGMEMQRRRFKFTTSVQNFRIKITGGSTGNAQRPFGISERIMSWAA